jgi:hypothetical protein
MNVIDGHGIKEQPRSGNSGANTTPLSRSDAMSTANLRPTPRTVKRTACYKIENSASIISEANEVLDTFAPGCVLECRRSRLILKSLYGENAIILGRDGRWPTFRYGRHGLGGTQALGIGQLARWIRGLSRVPAYTFWGWFGSKTADLLNASSYPNPDATKCVRCGKRAPGDWWSLDGVTGPCCARGCGPIAAKNPWALRVDGTIALSLNGGRYTIIDEADFPAVAPYRWTAKPSTRGTHFYVRTDSPRDVGLHQLICPCEPGLEADHIDGDPFNNRRSNLRPATRQQQSWNTAKPNRAGLTSRFKGVSWSKQKRKWCAEIRVNGTGKHIGFFSDEVEAAKAYDAVAISLRGEFARVNFPALGGGCDL